MRALLCRNNRGVANQGVVDTWERNKVGLELVQIDIESAVKSQRRSNRADNLSNEAVEMVKRRTGDVEISPANIIDCLVVH